MKIIHTIKPLFKNVILRGELEKTKLIIADDKPNKHRILSLAVFLKSDEVKTVEIGDEVRIIPEILGGRIGNRFINPFATTGENYKSNNEFYILVNEEEIVGKF